MDPKLLLPREQYAEQIAKYGRGPITLEIKNGHQILYYFGANHSRDPKNEQYPALKEYWNKFLEETNGKDRILLMEGKLIEVSENEELAIKTGSEGRLVTMWASHENIPVACPEPDPLQTLEKVLTQFSKEEAAYYRFAVARASWFRLAEPREGSWSFENFIARFFRFMKEEPGWEEFDWSLDNMKRIHKDLFNEDLHEYKRYPIDLLNPNIDDTKINKLSRFESDIREVHIVSEIERYWNDGKNIFIAFGKGHLVIQEPALKELLK